MGLETNPAWEYWANWGYASLLLITILGIAVMAVREVWNTKKPHLQAKWKAETEQSEQQALYIKKLNESHGEDMEYKRRQTILLEKLSTNQDGHSRACEATHRIVESIQLQISRVLPREED